MPILNASIRAQHKHEPTMRSVRVNGQITEVKQLKTKANSKIGDHLGPMHFVFFHFGCDYQKYLANLPNFPIQLNFRKNSIISCFRLNCNKHALINLDFIVGII